MNLTTTAIEETSVSLEWDPDPDATEQDVVRQREWDDGWSPEETIATLEASTSSYVDDTVHPGTTYRWQIVATLEDGSTVESEWLEATTTSLGIDNRPVPARGWYIEIDHPSGTTLKPQILDDVQNRPTLNSKSAAEIPVPRDESWLSAGFEDATLRAWKDGRQLPLDRLDDVEMMPDRTVLHATGGAQLDQRVRADVTTDAAHDFVAGLISEHTDYVVNVDEFAAEPEADELQSISTATEWEQVTEGVDLSSIPFEINGDGRLDLQQTCFTADGFDDTFDTNGDLTTGTDYSGVSPDSGNGSAIRLGNNQYAEYRFTINHRIPEDEVGAHFRRENTGGGTPGTEWILNGQVIDSLNSSTSIERLTLTWNDHASDPVGGDGWQGGALEPGEHVLRVETDGSGDGYTVIDHVALADNQYQYNFDNTVTTVSGENLLDGPEHYPVESIELDPAISPLSVVAGELVAVIDDTTNGQAVGIRNGQGQSYQTAQNDSTISTTFDTIGDRIQTRLTLSRYGEVRDETPRYGYQGQTVDSYTLSATLDDTPLLINQAYDGNLEDVLERIAGDVNGIWEVRRDPSTGELAIEWTWPGQRSADRDLDVVDYSTRKVTPNIQKATVYGGAQRIREEAFVADFDTPVDLDNAEIIRGSEAVSGPNSTSFRRGDDYEINRQAGTITVSSDGDMTDGEEYVIGYEFKTVGEFETDAYSGDAREEFVDTLAGLTTTQACAQAAKIIVDLGSTPRTEADVQFPPSVPEDISLVEALDLEAIPGDAMAVYNLQDGPDGLSARLGDRDRVQDRLSAIDSRIRAASDRV